MSMGQSKKRTIKTNRGNIIDRTPVKQLNPYIKNELIKILQRDDIVIETIKKPGDTVYEIKNNKDATLFVYRSAWNFGFYAITVRNIVLAETDWFETDFHTNPAQQDILDVLREIQHKIEKISILENAEKALTHKELQALNIMRQNQK